MAAKATEFDLDSGEQEIPAISLFAERMAAFVEILYTVNIGFAHNWHALLNGNVSLGNAYAIALFA
ncbi:MAG: hypothetical protein LBU32_31550 [Clostridiales bacterium]|jgi:hypothetical protein|nr:hypothetical protein [Clostridiales bacterium]